MERILGGSFKLSTGKEICANGNLLSIDKDMDIIYDGYDGTVPLKVYDENLDSYVNRFTAEEIAEICDYEIALWTKFKEKHS